MWRRFTVFPVLGLLALSAGCDKPKPKGTSQEAETAKPQKPKVLMGEVCAGNDDCASGLGCDKDKKCQTFKTIECRSREDSCKGEGRCTGKENRCIAATNEECKQSDRCAQDGLCAVKDERCAAVTADDCKDVCTKSGRCSVQDGKCVAATNDDCKKSDVCASMKKCLAKEGHCVKR
jgi:hypothetical protein